MSTMKVALVSPYSWSYPGGVTRHIDALAQQFIADGHEVRVLAPYDPPDFSSKSLHRGAKPIDAPLPDYVIPLGRTVGIKANGAVSNLSITPQGVAKVQRELRTGGYDVVHIHEPVAPLTSWFASDFTPLPLVGHVPLLLGEPFLQRRREHVRRAPGAQPSARADRGFAGRRLDRAPVLRRSLSRDPERRSRRRGRAGRGRTPDRRQAPDRVRRRRRRAQGPAAAAACVRGAARARPERTDGDRADP